MRPEGVLYPAAAGGLTMYDKILVTLDGNLNRPGNH